MQSDKYLKGKILDKTMKKGSWVILLVFIILVILFDVWFLFYNKPAENLASTQSHGTIRFNLSPPELGSLIASSQTCQDKAIDNWKDFSFQINSTTKCYISYFSVAPNRQTEVECTCFG